MISNILEHITALDALGVLYLVLSTIPAMFILWVFFINVMWMKHKGQKKYTHGWKKWLFYAICGPLALIGYLWDILFDILYGTFMFWGLPNIKRLTLSARMKHIIKTQPIDSWRRKEAVWICRYLVEPWDHNHCGLEDFPDTKSN